MTNTHTQTKCQISIKYTMLNIAIYCFYVMSLSVNKNIRRFLPTVMAAMTGDTNTDIMTPLATVK